MARGSLAQLIIIDVEATCWAKKEDKPPNEISEIIEIGICTFDITTWKPLAKHQIIVKPTQSTVSRYCTELTGWTQEALGTKGILLKEACNKLVSIYNTKKYVWASWGDYDRLQFERECNRKAIKYPFSVTHLNLKKIFAMHFSLTRGVGMCDALQKLGLALEGKHHNGADDAWNIGRILEAQGRF